MTTPPMTPATAVLIDDPSSVVLEDWGPLPEATAHPMATAGKTLWTGDGVHEVGLWQCAPGPSYYVQDTHESITVISGTMTITEDGGAPFDMGPGDSAFFPKGWAGTWDLHDTVLKVYTVF